MQTRSHLTQTLQNYFDVQDVRVRELPFSLDAQLLNAAAQAFELHQLRFEREISGRFLSSCPLNIDNRGVYVAVQLPNSMALSLDAAGNPMPPSSVVGVLNGAHITLSQFDDTLPVPSAAIFDDSQSIVSLSSPVLGTIDTAALGTIEPGVLPIPNRLSFWTSNVGDTVFLEVVITGQRWPRNLWPGAQRTQTESFILTSEGLSRSQNIYYSVESIEVFGLPQGGSVQVYGVEMALPLIADLSRPFTEWDERETTYDRYWQVAGGALKEVYYKNAELGFPDPPLISSIDTRGAVSDFAVEPFTFGGLAGGGSTLYYLDRREPMPDQLAVTALRAEPCYGLAVRLDDDPSRPRQAVLSLQPYGGAGSEVGHRFTVQMPDQSLWIYYRHASLGWTLRPWDSLFWTPGSPADGVSFALSTPGTHVFRLETRSAEGVVTGDAFPFLNRTLTPLAQFNVSLPAIYGVGFDAQNQLWLWDGAFLQPFLLTYQGYAWDASSRTLYLTTEFDSVQVTP